MRRDELYMLESQMIFDLLVHNINKTDTGRGVVKNPRYRIGLQIRRIGP